MGRRLNQKGYYEHRVLSHPFCNAQGYVREHRLVLEQHLRETDPFNECLVDVGGELYISREWDVHHINHDRLDNRVENLAAVRHDEHGRDSVGRRWAAMRETEEERKQIMKDIIRETIEEESNR